MENFPTPRRAVLPWAANIATLLVMVSATWWSSAQRPAAVGSSISAAGQTGATNKTKQTPRQVLNVPAQDGPKPSQATWPATTTSLQNDDIKAASYTALRVR